MKVVTMNDKFKIPYTGKRFREKNVKAKFYELDHPLRFYKLTSKEQNILLSWCSQFEKTINVNTRHTSYGMKHWFERSQQGFPVSNGAFKGAMILSGFKVDNPDCLNWRFNVSEKSVKECLNERTNHY